jgi:hypothetical protein
MTGHRLAGAIALGVILGLVWGATAGVVVATLIGYGTLHTMTVSLPVGVLVVGVPALVFTYKSLKPVEPGQSPSR